MTEDWMLNCDICDKPLCHYEVGDPYVNVSGYCFECYKEWQVLGLTYDNADILRKKAKEAIEKE